MIEKDEYPYWMALGCMRGLTTRRKNELVTKCCHELDSPVSSLFRNPGDPLFGVSESELPLFRESMANIGNFVFFTEDFMEQGYGIIPIFDRENYPKLIKENLKMPASPTVLYYKGNLELLKRDAVAVVGSRKASEISLRFAENIAGKAAAEGRPVVSGYAKGVDRKAHDSSLSHGGTSIVVLPQGIMTFSAGFREMYRDMVSGKILVISAFNPKAPWSSGFAMARNPYIYALASDIYVAESGSDGGTWSGAVEGLKRGRKIRVRYPGPEEKNANLQLADMGAVPVDMDGIPVAPRTDNEDADVKERILAALRTGEFTSAQIAKCEGVTWSSERIGLYLDNLESVRRNTVKKRTSYTMQDDLFSGL